MPVLTSSFFKIIGYMAAETDGIVRFINRDDCIP